MNQTREFVSKHLALQEPAVSLLSGPLLVIVHFRIPAPTMVLWKKRAAQNCMPHIKRPDGDNLEKFLNDALNGVLWSDDSKIAFLYRSKTITKAKQGETIIFVRELQQELPNYEQIIADLIENINPGDHDVA